METKANSATTSFLKSIIILFALASLFACAPTILPPSEMSMSCPIPIEGNSGKYMCPFTSDDVVAEWVDKAVQAKLAGSVGGAIGNYAGAKALEQVPFIGGFLGEAVGKKIGTEVAIKSAGGREFIAQTSDISFDNVDDLAVYLYVKHSSNQSYNDALQATYAIYPELKERYSIALTNASRNAY